MAGIKARHFGGRVEFDEEDIEAWESGALGADSDFVVVGSEEDHKQLDKLKEELKNESI